MKDSLALRLLLGIACAVIIIAGIKAAEAIIVPFILSLFLAIIFSPVVYWFNKRGFSTGFAAALVFLMGVLVMFGFTYMISQSLAAFTQGLPAIQGELQRDILDFFKSLEDRGITLPQEKLAFLENPGAILTVVSGLFSSITKILTDGVVILILMVFLLLEATDFPSKIRLMSHDPDQSLDRLDFLARQVFRYFAIKTFTSLLTGVAVTLWLMAFKVPYAPLLGILAFLMNFIPNVGSLLASIPALLIAAATDGFGLVLYTGFGYLVINNVIGWLVEPRMMGEGLGLSILVVILSLFFWGWVLGPVGMLLSAPLTMSVKIALEETEDTRWIAVLLSSGRGVTARLEELRRTRDALQMIDSTDPE